MRLPPLLGGVGLLALLLPLGAASLHGGGAAAGSRADATDTLPAGDPVARLQARIDRGEVDLPLDTALGYLPAVLRELDIPVSSQGLVFSRTSLQTDKIAPWAPRALYFNDDVYVGYVLGSDFLEIASVDPAGGTNFYTMMQHEAERPVFNRETTACLMCHSSTITDGVPGLIVLSTFADRHGYRIGSVHEGTTTDQTPHEKRWGGWYVTGTHEGGAHSGNTYSPKLYSEIHDAARHRREFDLTSGSGLVSLEAKFHAEGYLSGHSDLVALMVLAHQTRVHNLISALHLEVEEAARLEPELLSSGGIATGEGPRSRGELQIAGAASRLLAALLFANEAPLRGRVRGSTDFAEEFARRGPRDSRGRSLRDLDLERRLFRYPLSFLVYSDAFDALPEIARRMLYSELWAVLKGERRGAKFDHLDEADRRAILEILEETRPEFVELRSAPPSEATAR